MKNKLFVFIILIIIVIPTCLTNLAKDKTDYVENVVVSYDKLNQTDLLLVKEDFKNIDPESNINLFIENEILIVEIIKGKNKNDLKANYVNITQYTDWCLKNIKLDVRFLDITVKLPDSSISAKLDMNMVIYPDLPIGFDTSPFFEESYIKESIY